MAVINRLLTFYALHIYLPVSSLGRHWRMFSRRLRGRYDKIPPPTRLPRASWRQCAPPRPARLYEPKNRNGNVRLSELAILARFAADALPGSNLFEIGTFDGRTTLNLAMNAPIACRIITLDLPPDSATRYEVVDSERQYIDKPQSGQRLNRYRDADPSLAARIDQRFGDSATYDFSPFHETCSIVFVDGSHAYEYAQSDTAVARRLIRPGGVIIWHDYGVWPGVTRALEELEDHEQWGLIHIAGTSLVYWRRPLDAVAERTATTPSPPDRSFAAKGTLS